MTIAEQLLINKTDLDNINNNVDNQADLISQIKSAVNALPEAVHLPQLDNPGTASDLVIGTQLIDEDGNRVDGTLDLQAKYDEGYNQGAALVNRTLYGTYVLKKTLDVNALLQYKFVEDLSGKGVYAYFVQNHTPTYIYCSVDKMAVNGIWNSFVLVNMEHERGIVYSTGEYADDSNDDEWNYVFGYWDTEFNDFDAYDGGLLPNLQNRIIVFTQPVVVSEELYNVINEVADLSIDEIDTSLQDQYNKGHAAGVDSATYKPTEGLEYIEDDYYIKGTLMCRGRGTVTSTNVHIADFVDGKMVTGLAGSTFMGNNTIKKLTIPDTIMTEENLGALNGMQALEEINIGHSFGILEGGFGDFTHCPNLRTINVSEYNPKFTAVDDVFYSKDLGTLYVYAPKKEGETFEFLNTTTRINDNAFAENANIKTLVIPSHITHIGQYAFAYMKSLESVYFTNPDVELSGCFGNGFTGDIYVTWSEEEAAEKDMWFETDPGDRLPTVHYNWIAPGTPIEFYMIDFTNPDFGDDITKPIFYRIPYSTGYGTTWEEFASSNDDFETRYNYVVYLPTVDGAYEILDDDVSPSDLIIPDYEYSVGGDAGFSQGGLIM